MIFPLSALVMSHVGQGLLTASSFPFCGLLEYWRNLGTPSSRAGFHFNVSAYGSCDCMPVPCTRILERLCYPGVAVTG